ncbi:hypothetical protein NKG94_22360 [Micromonospora sp. M12]
MEARHTYLLCVPGTVTTPPTPDGFNLCEPGTDDQRAALISAQNEAFGGDPVASTADVARLRRQQEAGGVVVMAVTDDGTCAGGGAAAQPTGAVSEVAGIAVRTPYRGRGWRARSPPTSPDGSSPPTRRSPGWRPPARIPGGFTSASAIDPPASGSTSA